VLSEYLCRLYQGHFRTYHAVGPYLHYQPVIIGPPTYPGIFRVILYVPYRREHRIYCNEAYLGLFGLVLFSSDITPPFLHLHLHNKALVFRKGDYMLFGVDYLYGTTRGDILGPYRSFFIGFYADLLGLVVQQFQHQGFDVKDNVSGILYHPRYSTELMLHPFDLYRGNGTTFQAVQQHPS